MTTYCRPGSVQEALQALADANGAGRVLVGGTDLLVGLRRQPLGPLVLVDLKTASDLPPPIEVTDTTVRFGPTAVMTDLATNAQVSRWFPALIAASRVVGSVAIRNRASLIGNISNASPAADTAPALLVHQARVTIVGPGGERTMPLTEFFLGPGKTACGADELVFRLEVPVPPTGHRSAFERLTRRRGVDLATVSVAAVVADEGRITLGLGAVGPTPLLTRTSGPTDLTDGAELDQVIEELIQIATPISDVRAGESYRRAMTAVLARRAVLAAGTTSNGAM